MLIGRRTSDLEVDDLIPEDKSCVVFERVRDFCCAVSGLGHVRGRGNGRSRSHPGQEELIDGLWRSSHSWVAVKGGCQFSLLLRIVFWSIHGVSKNLADVSVEVELEEGLRLLALRDVRCCSDLWELEDSLDLTRKAEDPIDVVQTRRRRGCLVACGHGSSPKRPAVVRCAGYRLESTTPCSRYLCTWGLGSAAA